MKGVIKQVGRYVVGQVVGEGSFGKVYKGVDMVDKTEVALKFISKRGKNKKELQGLRSENQMLKKISHPNIIKLLDFIQTGTQVIIITEYAGENLAEILQKKKKFNYQDIKIYCKQILNALCYLDENRIAHRDLKPQNILIKNQNIKICDFGFARKLSASTTFMNSLKGTPLYIAPEMLANGPLNYTKRVDVWSFGIIIYELYAGRPPFWAENLARLKPKILHEKVRFPRQMPIQLRALIDKMLQKNPETRATWQQLKKESFFSDIHPLKDISLHTQNIEHQKVQYVKVSDNDPVTLRRQNSKQVLVPQEEVGKVQKLATQSDVEQIKKVQLDLQSLRIQAKKLRTDFTFLQRVISIYGSYFSGDTIIPKQTITSITSIIIHLLTKVKPCEVDGSMDITKKKQLLFCAIKYAQQDTDPQTLPNQLVLIGFLIKNNFNNFSIDYQTDQDILEICLREIKWGRNGSCFSNALTILGTLASQAIITINNSDQFFVKVEEERIVSSIAETYQPIPSKRIVLQCIQKFIHSHHHSVTLSKNHQSLKKIFRSIKIQAASTLLQRKFLIYNPITIFKQITHVQSYARILYECINVSDQFRKQFLKSSYWVEFLQYKNLKIFCLAYDIICIQKDKVCLIPNELMKGIAASTELTKKNSTLEKVLYFARAEFYLSKKQTQTHNKQQTTLKILYEICEIVCIDEQSKKIACRQVQGFLCTGQRIFQQVIGQTFCNILTDQAFNKSSIQPNLITTILQNLLSYKIDEEIKVSILTASKIMISIDELMRMECSRVRGNKKISDVVGNLIGYFFNHGIVYQIQLEQGSVYTKKIMIALFSLMKMIGGVDQKVQFNLYCMAEEKGLHTLLVSESILDKTTLSICLTLLLKLVAEKNYTNAVTDFVGITLIDKFKNYLKLDHWEGKDSEIVVQILHAISSVIKKNEQYASKIKQLDVVSHFPRYLQHPTNQNLRQQTLTLIGNMAKHSQYFFQDFANHNIFSCIVETVKRFGQGSKCKILKGIVYAMGNVSFYTDRFVKDFILLIPSIYVALNTDDSYLISNTMSTISNLLRHSNCYLQTLIENKVIRRVIQIIMQQNTQDNKLLFGLNMIKKVLVYPQIFDVIPRGEFLTIYSLKVGIVGEENECMKKIKTII